jgi:hypothetical protein
MAMRVGQPRIETPVLRIGPGRLAFPNLFEPKASNDGGDEKYETTLLLPADYDVAFILKALTDVCVVAWGPDRARWPSTARKPEQVVRSCNEKQHLAGYERDWHFITCRSGEPPSIVGWDKSPVTSEREVYGGRWANITARPYCYNNRTIGVSLGLNNVQLLQNDNKFARTSADQDFDVVEAAVANDF